MILRCEVGARVSFFVLFKVLEITKVQMIR
jgi:hypothetical protein